MLKDAKKMVPINIFAFFTIFTNFYVLNFTSRDSKKVIYKYESEI